jgi:hypothetical protein
MATSFAARQQGLLLNKYIIYCCRMIITVISGRSRWHKQRLLPLILDIPGPCHFVRGCPLVAACALFWGHRGSIISHLTEVRILLLHVTFSSYCYGKCSGIFSL